MTPIIKTSLNTFRRNSTVLAVRATTNPSTTTTAKRYQKALHDTGTTLVIATGPAGTGKTMLACTQGMNGLADGMYERMILTRPLVPVGGEDIGFLPGDMHDKMTPWVSHMVDYVDRFDLKFIQSKIDVVPFSYMRGETWENKWIIADEMQNSTPIQMKTLLTRIGNNSKLVITGDLSQSDLPDAHLNGLRDLLNRLESDSSDFHEHLEFVEDDIQRSAFVKSILRLYSPAVEPCRDGGLPCLD